MAVFFDLFAGLINLRIVIHDTLIIRSSHYLSPERWHNAGAVAIYQSIKLKNLKEKFFRNFKVFPKTYYGFHYWHYSRIFCVALSYHQLIIKANSCNDSQNYNWKAYSWVETISRKWKPFNPIWGRLFQGREVVQLTILDIFKSISWTIWLKIWIVNTAQLQFNLSRITDKNYSSHYFWCTSSIY